MIRFSLICDGDHDFDGWFGSSEDFDTQCKRGLIACPVCNSIKVEKSLMAPQVATGRQKEAVQVATLQAARQEALKELRRIKNTITENADNVGKAFPEEARKIHYGETKARGIYGEATRADVESLVEEGVEIAPLPVLPDEAN